MKRKIIMMFGITAMAYVLSFILFNLLLNIENVILNLILILGIPSALGAIYAVRLSGEVNRSIERMIYLTNQSTPINNSDNDFSYNIEDLERLELTVKKFKAVSANNLLLLGKKNQELISTLNSVSDGVVAVNSSLEIMFINIAAMELFNIFDNAEGKYFLEVFLDNRLDKIVQNVINKPSKVSLTIQTKLEEPKILKVDAVSLQDKGIIIGAVLQLHDVTELTKLEQMRSDFVANVSHELKTPLTSIKGFVDTLLEGAVKDDKTTRKFLEIIRIETDRLTRLINDILCLSEIEIRKGIINKKKVNFSRILKEIIDMMKLHAQAKDILIEFESEKNDLWIYAETDRVKQMFINLIDNAIKYTPSSGKVLIRLERESENVILSIKDNGIGIPNEHLSRIFERFYRVDKGRSRGLGGTGLGLAIVKHIVRSMNGSIEVKSQLGKGTEFTVQLPLEKSI